MANQSAKISKKAKIGRCKLKNMKDHKIFKIFGFDPFTA